MYTDIRKFEAEKMYEHPEKMMLKLLERQVEALEKIANELYLGRLSEWIDIVTAVKLARYNWNYLRW